MRSGRKIQLLLYLFDAVLIVVSTLIAYFVRFEGKIPSAFSHYMLLTIGLSLAIYLVAFTLMGAYRVVLRHVSVETAFRLAGATLISFVLLTLIDLFVDVDTGMRFVPFGVLFIQALLIFLLGSLLRLSSRIRLHMESHPLGGSHGGRRVLIVGAGSSGSLLLHELEVNPGLGLDPVGFLDDDPSLRHREVRGVPIVGTTDQLAQKARELHVDEVIVALPSAPKEEVRKLLNVAADNKLTTRIVPPIVIEKGSVATQDLRRVEVEDLLGREETPIDVDQVRSTIEGKIVAVTGAAGSIGSELCRQIVKLDPAKLLLIEVDESRLYELWMELGGDRSCATMCLCDITDARKLGKLLDTERPEVVLHAAAYKHVPLMEMAPDEAVRVNVGGTRTLLDACEHAGVKRFVLISTDKAVAPTSVMGATKAIAELLMLEEANKHGLLAVAVRFGNVLGSRGSVIPLFEEQLRHGGPVLVTHEDMTRYYMTIPEASRLVLQAQAIGKPGDIFVLEMGEPIKTIDLAQKMISLSGVPAEIEIVGLRPAEKLHEILATDSETLVPTQAQRIMRVEREMEIDPHFDERINVLLDISRSDEGAIRPTIQSIIADYVPFTMEGETSEINDA